MENIPVVVLAGGVGERIKVLTGGKPKALLSLLGRYLVEYVLDNIVKLGFKNVFIVVNDPRNFEDIANRYGKQLRIEVIPQKKPEIEGAILSVRDAINSDFILVYGDVIAPTEMYKELVSLYAEGKYGVVLVPEEEAEEYTVAKLKELSTIDVFVSGSSIFDTSGYYAVGGAYVLPKEFLDYIETYSNFINALNTINKNYKLRPTIWSGWWIDIEYPWDLLRATLYVLHHLDKTIISSTARISTTSAIEGSVIIDDNVEVDHFAIIKGPVYIGRNCYIGSHTLIRSYVSLEGNNVVGAYSEIVWSSIQKNTTIGSRSYIGFSVIGEDSTIEPGVVTLNIIPEHMRIARAIRIERRGREYIKVGAIIGSRARVKAYTVLKPCEIVS
jgi:glucose-1-phosphate thymidylyltransferase